jgi:hypothetical protein
MFNLPWCRTLSCSALAVIMAICCSWGMIFAEDQVIKLGGIRNVTATIFKSDKTYRISVEMRPVKAFDTATNKQMNLIKAQTYAARALAKHLGNDKSTGLIIHGLEVRESGISGERFRMVAEIPHSGVTVAAAQLPSTKDVATVSAHQPPQAASSQRVIRVAADATTTDFLNRKADYLNTIAELREALTDDGKAMERSPLTPDDFYEAVGNLEERSNVAFRSLGALIDGDELLVSIEQDELRLALRTANAATLESLKATVTRFEGRQEKTKKEKE